MKALLTPKKLAKFCAIIWPKLLGFSLLSLIPTLIWIMTKVPIDFQQGIVAKIMYIHIPSAILSLGLFAVIGIASILFLVYKIKIAPMLIRAILPIGLMSTIIVLVTGSIWGKPTWGTWWIWDARLTSELLLGFIYLMLYTYDKVTNQNNSWVVAVLALIGLIDLPIIHYSVTWWHTLHQGPSILALQKPTIAWPMLWPLLLMIINLACLTAAIVLLRCQIIVDSFNRKT